MTGSSSNRNVVEVLAEEFVERHRTGDRPPVSEYTRSYPEYAEEIEDLFPALLLMENLKPAEEDEPAPPTAEPALKQIGDYRILGEVGRGGMGIVYEAEQLSLGRRVAVKVLPQQLLLDETHKRRFAREARAAARLHHTNIVPVFGVGEQNGMHYYVMQFIRGLGLDEVLHELRRMPADSQVEVSPAPAEAAAHRRRELSAADVARSLVTGQFAQTVLTDLESPSGAAEFESDHDADLKVKPGAGVVATAMESAGLGSTASGHSGDSIPGQPGHCDSLPLTAQGNSALSASSGRARRRQTFFTSVANIGRQVASALQYAHEHGITHRDIKPSNLLLDMQGTVWVTDFGLAKTSDQQDITRTGDILGTLRYMPPEAFEGRSDPAGDQYSLGLTLYELLARRPAFDESDRHKLIKLVTTSEPARIDKVNPDVPHDLATIIHKSIDRDPAHRYASAGDLADDLERFLDDVPIKARRISVSERLGRWSRRNRGLAASLAVVAVLLLVINIAGPVMTWKMAGLNRELRASETVLLSSQSELTGTVEDLTRTKGELERTVETLESTQTDLVAARDEARDRAEQLQVQSIELEHRREQAERRLYAARLALAENFLNATDAVNAQRSLDAAIPEDGETDRRGWEWHYLARWLNSAEQTWLGHSRDFVSAVAFSPDGRLLASAGGGNPYYLVPGQQADPGEVLLRDVQTGRVLHRLEGHERIVSTLAFSPDGGLLATGGHDQRIILWNSETGDETLRIDVSVDDGLYERVNDLRRVNGPGLNVRTLQFSPDGGLLLALLKRADLGEIYDGVAIVYSLTEERALHQVPVTSAALSHDGSSLYFAYGPAVQALEMATGNVTDLLPRTGSSAICFGVACSASGAWLAVVRGDRVTHTDFRQNQVLIWKLDTSELVHKLPVEPGVVRTTFSDDDRLLCTSGYTGVVQIWDTAAGRNVATVPGTAKIMGADFSPDGRWLAVGDFEGAVRLLAADRDPRGSAIESGQSQSSALRFTSDGRAIRSATWYDKRDIGSWDVLTQEQQFSLPLTTPKELRWPRGDFAFSPDADRLAAPREDDPGAMTIWDSVTGEDLISLADHPGPVSAVAFRADGELVATACSTPTAAELRLWDATTGELNYTWEVGRRVVNGIAFSPDGSSLAIGGTAADSEPGVSIWDVQTGEAMRHFHGPAQVYGLAFSPDGSRLAAADYGRYAVDVWDAEAGEQIGEISGIRAVADVAWSPDGTRLAAIGYDANVHLCHAETLEELIVLRTLGPPVGTLGFTPRVAFSPNGTRIAGTSPHGVITVWDAGEGSAEEGVTAKP